MRNIMSHRRFGLRLKSVRPCSKGLQLLTLALLLVPAGCAVDPYNTPGTWHAGTTNADNLAAQVVNKRDLVAGEPMYGSDGQLDAAAIDRLHTGKLKTISAATTSSVGSSGGGSGGSGGSN